ncbi:MAG: ComF family protein, partial [Limnochordales bacterium]
GVYDGALRDYIHRVKFGADRALGETLGRFLAEYALRTRELWPFDAVVPVPLHAQRLAERGFNQAELLARPVAHYCGRPLLRHVLERVRPTAAQARMPVGGRRANVRGAFRVRAAAALAGKRLLLVDDVLTSGETAGEAARVLLRAGAAQVRVLCWAVGVHEAEWRARQRAATSTTGRTANRL